MSAPVIDCQVHCYERDHPDRPWVGHLAGPPEVTGDDMVAHMDAVGVDGALLVSPWSMYRYDASYALEVHEAHPDRFGLIKPFDPASPSVVEEIDDWAGRAGTVGVRIVYLGDAPPAADDPGINRVIAAATRHGLPVNMLCWGHVALFGELARRHPDAQMVLDHLGLTQPFAPPPPAAAFADLEQVLALAACDNVAIKISGACTLSHEPFPYPDLWPPLARIFDAFGIARCLWGTDWTRAVDLLTYEQGVAAFRDSSHLSDDERAALMGGNLVSVYNWTPGRG